MSERIARGLGASRPVGTSSLVFFVPSTNRLGASIDHDYWVDATVREFGRIFRGATAYPRGRGVWRDDERGGALVLDEPTIVISYFDPEILTDEALRDLRAFFHRLGREAHQGEVGVVINDAYYGMTEYDSQP